MQYCSVDMLWEISVDQSKISNVLYESVLMRSLFWIKCLYSTRVFCLTAHITVHLFMTNKLNLCECLCVFVCIAEDSRPTAE